MPKIIVKVSQLGDDSGQLGDASGPVTFAERVLAINLGDEHYAAQFLQRLRWAVADAEALQERSRAGGESSDVQRTAGRRAQAGGGRTHGRTRTQLLPRSSAASQSSR